MLIAVYCSKKGQSRPRNHQRDGHFRNRQETSMKKNDKIHIFKKKEDLLDEIFDKKDPDDLGLLDLVLVEEMLNQKNKKNTT